MAKCKHIVHRDDERTIFGSSDGRCADQDRVFSSMSSRVHDLMKNVLGDGIPPNPPRTVRAPWAHTAFCRKTPGDREIPCRKLALCRARLRFVARLALVYAHPYSGYHSRWTTGSHAENSGASRPLINKWVSSSLAQRDTRIHPAKVLCP